MVLGSQRRAFFLDPPHPLPVDGGVFGIAVANFSLFTFPYTLSLVNLNRFYRR